VVQHADAHLALDARRRNRADADRLLQDAMAEALEENFAGRN
jgi:hypothetical protein